MTSGEPNLGEQALSKVVEMGIASQLDEVEQLDVDIRTDPLKLVQGEVSSVAIVGEGMVMQQDLRMEAVEIKTDQVAINPLSALTGKIELTQPTSAAAQVVLTEADLNRALSSDYLRPKLQNLEVQTLPKPITIDVQQASIHLPGQQKIGLESTIFLQEMRETKALSVLAVPSVQDNGQRIDLALESAEGGGLSVEFLTALFERIVELLDLRNFNLKGMSIQIQTLEAQVGQLLLRGTTTVEQFPSV